MFTATKKQKKEISSAEAGKLNRRWHINIQALITVEQKSHQDCLLYSNTENEK